MKKNRKITKLFSLILSLIMLSTYIIVPVEAAEPMYLSFYMDGFLITTDYQSDEYYAVEREVEEGFRTEIYDNEGNLTEIFELSEDEPSSQMARGTGYVSRTFSSQKVESYLGVGLYGVKHTVILNIYVYGSFKQIEGVADKMVTAADGIGIYTVENATSNVIAPNGYPTTSVDCTATAACEGAIDISVGVAAELGFSVNGLISAGVSVTGTVGTTVYFRNTITHNWSISI